ncbi:MAG: outer membrane beta-barrel protein [Bacteroidota bacterium]
MRPFTAGSIIVVALSVVLSAIAPGQVRPGKFGIGASGSYLYLDSDFKTPEPSFGGGVDLSYSVTEYFGLRASMGIGQILAKNDVGPSLEGMLVFGNFYLSLDLMPHQSVNPYLIVGATGMFYDPRDNTGAVLPGAGSTRIKVTGVGGVGFDIFVSEFFSFTIGAEAVLPATDRLDGVVAGSKKDLLIRGSVGFKYYFFDQNFITTMLKAVEERYRGGK